MASHRAPVIIEAPLRPKSPLRSSNMMLPEPVELDVDIDALGPRFGW